MAVDRHYWMNLAAERQAEANAIKTELSLTQAVNIAAKARIERLETALREMALINTQRDRLEFLDAVQQSSDPKEKA